MSFRTFFLALFIFVSAASAHAHAGSKAVEAIRGDLVGEVAYYKVRPKDTLYKIAHQFDVGIVALVNANPGVDMWTPHPGTTLTVPKQRVLPPAKRRGIVINLAEMRLYYYPDPRTVMTFPIGIGMEGWETPTGTTSVIKKRENPSWIPPASIRAEDPTLPEIFPPGPGNPLGKYALNLGLEGYRIHGTHRPDSIGRRSSHGCIRLYPKDIARLFDAVKVGTTVNIIDRPYKLGWRNGVLFLEITTSQQEADLIMRREVFQPADIPELYGDIQSLAQGKRIDWEAVRDAITQRSGIPVAVAGKE